MQDKAELRHSTSFGGDGFWSGGGAVDLTDDEGQ